MTLTSDPVTIILLSIIILPPIFYYASKFVGSYIARRTRFGTTRRGKIIAAAVSGVIVLFLFMLTFVLPIAMAIYQVWREHKEK
jgi:hypothetical protein